MATQPPPQRRRHSQPVLVEDIISEILLRLPPDDPARLVRFSLVCKPWRRLLTDPAFLRRFRAFHRTPPMLGFLCNLHDPVIARFLPTTAFRPPNRDHRGLFALDARHGRVLFHTLLSDSDGLMDLIVWDPITGGQWGLHMPGIWLNCREWNAAVLCAAGGCDHLDCHGGPFRVVFVCTDDEMVTFARVYSSEAAAWSGKASIEHHDATVGVDTGTSVLVGKTLYFPCNPSTRIVEYDLDKRGLSMIDPPFAYGVGKVLMAAEGGGLGLAGVRGSSLYLLSREATGPKGAVAWAQRRIIELEPLLPVRALWTSPFVIGFADGVGVIFLGTDDGIFTIELKSGRVKKVYRKGRSFEKVIPYMSFYTPDHATGILSPP